MKYFYDSHCHLFTLSHPNLIAFVERFVKKSRKQSFWDKIKLFFSSLWNLGNMFKTLKQAAPRVINLFSLMENDMFGMLKIIAEKDLAFFYDRASKTVTIGETRYDKFVMTPLIMDYGYKWQDKLEGDEIYYDEIAAKPVVNQTLDLLNGIADFYRSSPSYRDWIEIYPFLGINPINYSFGDETTERIYEWVSKTNIPSNLQSVADFLPLAGKPGLIFKGRMSEEQKQSLMTLLTDKRSRQAVERIYRRSQHIGDKTAKPRNTLPRMLDKYFKDYGKKTGASRYEALKSHLGKFDGDIHVSELAYYFAGIKLYPPLGFHPWPSDNPYELAKVKYLYQFCIDNRIPITVHCGSDGFAVVDNPDSLTDPANWQKALSYTDEKGVQPYRELTINLAHWGGDALTNHKWLDIIGDLIVEYPNVYTDLSCQLFEPDAYRRVPECITTTGKDDKARIAKIRSRILFGSDFSINLAIQARSYQEYLKAYSETSELTKEEKQSYAQSNAERFLWGIEG